MHDFRRILRAIVMLLAVGLIWPPAHVAAHPADEYLQAAYLRLGSDAIGVQLDLTPGPLVAPALIALLDRDGDGQVSAAESQAYAEQVASALELTIDGQPAVLRLDTVNVPELLLIEAGGGAIQLNLSSAAAVATVSDDHELIFRNTHQPVKSVYQANTLLPHAGALTIDRIQHDATQQALTVSYRVAAGTPAVGVAARAADALGIAPLVAGLAGTGGGPWWALLALAGALGGLHALTPGHGKTLVAAYLVGSRGTVRHAIALGAVVTSTHTASVIVIGVLSLFASQFVVPNVLMPVLETVSGLLVVVLGVQLVWQRGIARHRRRSPDHGHSQPRHHDHDGDHQHASFHDYGDGHSHTHLPPAKGLTLGGLVAMGVSGGLAPCPEALGIMIVAVGLGRIVLGLGLIVAFSVGLAAVLMVIGILLVGSRPLVERYGGIGSRWSGALPFASAVIVTTLGVGMTLRGLVTYLG